MCSGDQKLLECYLSILKCADGDVSEATRERRLEQLRRKVLMEGLPEDASERGSLGDRSNGSLRGTIWKTLLGVGAVDVEDYIRFVELGPSADYEKIRNDVYRAFGQHMEYKSRVPREGLVRLLNAHVHRRGNEPETYVQSMSVLAAPFLFLMPEPEAFASFDVLLRDHIPDYVRKYVGVHRGCSLLSRCLQSLDGELYQRLDRHQLKPQMYAFPNISTLGMCVQPLSESMRLLDIQLAYGSHLGVLFSLGRLMLARERILSVAPGKMPLTTRDMETGLGVRSTEVIECTKGFILKIKDELYNELLGHTGAGWRNPSQDLTLSKRRSSVREYLQQTAHSHLRSAEPSED